MINKRKNWFVATEFFDVDNLENKTSQTFEDWLVARNIPDEETLTK